MEVDTMRLLIVDDGHYIVEYIKHLLDWNKMGFESVRTTTNSIEALQILDRDQIDILITDIRMPEVSGIDLLEHINKNKLQTKVIFLTGYSDFEYTQKAIRLGAVDYLLKPVDKNDMERSMKKMMETIEEVRLKTKIDWENFDGLGYFLSVLSEHHSLTNDYNIYDEALIREPFCYFQVSNAREKDEMILRDNCDGLDRFIWATDSTLAGIVLKSCTGILESRIENIVFSENFQFNQKNAVRHYFYQFFLNETVTNREFEMLRDYIVFPKLATGEWESVRKNAVKLFSQPNLKKVKTICLMELIHFLYFTNNKLQSSEVKDWIFSQLKDPDAAFKSITLAVTQMEKNTRLSNDDIIHTVQTYVADHLSDSLSLDELGSIVHLHPVYLSKLYKQETGENLSNYISTKRLEKASRLLLDSNLHVLDISHLVGYKKPQYFIKLFKDQYGITPQQYRKNRLGRELK
jgi:two-component system response regulator YesN